MKKTSIIFLCIIIIPLVYAQDSTVKNYPLVTSSKTFNIGSINVLDPYLSPYEYNGTRIGYMTDNRRFIRANDTTLSYTSRAILNISTADHPNKNNSMLMFEGYYNLGINYHIRPFEKFMVLIGGSWDVDLGGKYISRNVNNPFSLDLYTNINATAEVQYEFNFLKQNLRLQYGVQTPLIGYMFVPMQGASYYELFSLNNLSDAFHFSSLHNRRAWMQYFHLDIPLRMTTLRLGIQHDFLQYSANDMVFHKKGFNFSIGYIIDFYTFSGKKNKILDNFTSSYK